MIFVGDFRAGRKWSGAWFGGHGTWVLGAPEIVLQSDDADGLARAGVLAQGGQRVLALSHSLLTLEGASLPSDRRWAAFILLEEHIRDDAPATPQGSYGAQKAMCELLLNDATRKGFMDARILRLPTVVVRPGAPNKAASSFASAIIREPLAGKPAVCPVDPDVEMWVISQRQAVRSFMHAHELEGAVLGANRTLLDSWKLLKWQLTSANGANGRNGSNGRNGQGATTQSDLADHRRDRIHR